MVWQLGHGTYTVGHGGDAALIQPQTVQHHIGNFAPSGLHIQGVGVKDIRCVPAETLCHGQEQAVFFLCR